GRDELGDHAGGTSEKDHEQHTDYESPDAASSRHRCSGVMDCDGPPRTGRKKNNGEKKQDLSGSSAWDGTRDNRQSKRTSVMSDSSGCVWSEIIPLFLSEGLWSASFEKGAKERKRAKNNNNKKKEKLPGRDDLLFFFFSSPFLEALTNSTTYQKWRT
ncbi:Ephrin type-A receptor 7, partial [Scomber scombrus]